MLCLQTKEFRFFFSSTNYLENSLKMHILYSKNFFVLRAGLKPIFIITTTFLSFQNTNLQKNSLPFSLLAWAFVKWATTKKWLKEINVSIWCFFFEVCFLCLHKQATRIFLFYFFIYLFFLFKSWFFAFTSGQMKLVVWAIWSLNTAIGIELRSRVQEKKGSCFTLHVIHRVSRDSFGHLPNPNTIHGAVPVSLHMHSFN